MSDFKDYQWRKIAKNGEGKNGAGKFAILPKGYARGRRGEKREGKRVGGKQEQLSKLMNGENRVKGRGGKGKEKRTQ